MEWTEQRIETLRKLWGQGQTASQIAAILGGVTRNAVIGKAHRLGLTGRPSPIKRETSGNVQPKRRTTAAAPARRMQQPSQSIPQTRHSTQPLTAPAMPQMSQPQPRSETTPPAPSKSHAARAAHGGSKSCSWPMGDPKQAGFHFCGEPAEPGRPYCTNHCHVAYHKKSEAA